VVRVIHLDFGRRLPLQGLETGLDFFLEDIAHGGERYILVRFEGLSGCARAAAAAADQPDFKRGVIAPGKELGMSGASRQDRGANQSSADQGGRFQKIPAGRIFIGIVHHKWFKEI
jgi:hypothetical protein